MSGENKIKVIAIVPNCPAYDFTGGPGPDVSWKTASGAAVGFWAREWNDLLGAEVLKLTGDLSWESWQPDLRADKEYSAALPTGVVHRLFPAERRLCKVGLRRQEAVFSDAMLEALEKERSGQTILMLGTTYGFHNPFFRAILAAFGPDKNIPVFLRSDGMFNHPLGEFPRLHKPLTYLSLLCEHFQVKKLLAHADVISEWSDAGLALVRQVYRGRVERLTFGCDFDFWITPPPGGREAARERAGIPKGKKVFYASGNYLPRKQLDKLAAVFLNLAPEKDFYFIVSGQGPSAALSSLRKMMEPLELAGKGRLNAYAEGENLRDLYWASDAYISSATDEGGPVTVMKAMACGVPVISTPVGDTADFLRETGTGRLVPVKDYAEWERAICEVIDAKPPAATDVAAARARYGWPEVAARYAAILKELSREYFEGRV